MRGAGMQRRDRHGVEQAEAHGAGGLGVVARRAHGAEGVLGGAGHDLVDGMDRGAGRAQGCLEAAGRDDGVGIEPVMVALGDRRAHRLDIGLGMEPLDHGEIGARGLLTREIMKALVFERVLDGAQAVGPLGMAEARIMLEAGRMGQKQGCHGVTLFIKHKHA